MLLVKQLHCINLNGALKLSKNMHQIVNSTQLITTLQPVNHLSTIAQFEINNGTNLPRSNSHNFIGIRHYYRNYESHPWKIVRAYRKTRTWLTDHFVVGDRRFENIYSFTFLVTIIMLGIWSMYLNLQVGGEAGSYDVDRVKKHKPE